MLKSYLSIIPIICLYGCVSTPPVVDRNLASKLSKTSDSGTAIAFQFDAPSCESGSFRITPKKKVGENGESILFIYRNTGISFKPTGLTGKYLNIDPSNKYKLHAKFVPAGTYLLEYPVCQRTKRPFVVRKMSPRRSFEFEAVVGKTNYIGNIRVQRNLHGLKWEIVDDIEVVENEYKKRYGGKGVGIVQSSIAKMVEGKVITSVK